MSQREAVFSSYAILNHLPDSTPIFSSQALSPSRSLASSLSPSPSPAFLPSQLSARAAVSHSLWCLPVISGNSSHAQGCIWNTSIPLLVFVLQYSSHEGTLCWLAGLEWVTLTGSGVQPELRNGHLRGNPFTVATPPFVQAHTCGVLRWIPPSVISVRKLQHLAVSSRKYLSSKIRVT